MPAKQVPSRIGNGLAGIFVAVSSQVMNNIDANDVNTDVERRGIVL